MLTTELSAQEFNRSLEHVTLGDQTAIATLEGSEGTWIIVGTRSTIHWTKDGGRRWVVESFSNPPEVSDIAVVGDSMFVVTGSFGLLRLSESDTQLKPINPGPQLTVYSFTDVGSGDWLKAGEVGVSRSGDEGATWSVFNELFVNNCCTSIARLRFLGDGHVVSWALTGIIESNTPRFHYSVDDGVTWADSSDIALISPQYEMLSTPDHVELHVAGKQLFARKSWDSPRIEFGSDFRITDATYSSVWGVVVSSESGVYRLDETTFEWTKIGFDGALLVIAAGSQGSLFVGEPGTGRIWKWTTVATGVDSPEILDDDKIQVYPNPAHNRINVEGAAEGWATIAVYDLLGREHLAVSGYARNREIPIHTLKPGLYFILVQEFGGRTSRASFIKTDSNP